MSGNSSSLLSFSNLSDPHQEDLCFRARVNIGIFSAFFITYILLLPVFFSVFYLGYQQWRTQRSMPTTAAFNPDVFTYHSVTMQLSEFLGLFLHFCGGYYRNMAMRESGLALWIFTTVGQTLFHLLSCLELYLAVVHPIIFLGLRKPTGIRIRNSIIGCVWLLSFGWVAFIYTMSPIVHFYMNVCFLTASITVVSFCSFFILCALKRPVPGDGPSRQQAGPSKQRAFHTIIAVFGALLLRFCSNLTSNLIQQSGLLSNHYVCVVFLSAFWLDIPSNLILPLLFLRRAGKLP